MKDSKCHLDAATMDSPASVNFYDNHDIEKQLTVIKQEPFDSDETHGGLGLGDFLNSEESVDLWAYLDRYEHQGANNAQISTRNTVTDQRHQRLNTLPPAPSAQQTDSTHTTTRHTSDPAIHYENLTPPSHQVININMPLNTPHTHSQNIGDQADSIVPELNLLQYMEHVDMAGLQQHQGQAGMEVEVESETIDTSACSSVASSPGRPMSSDMQASTTNSPGGGAGKKRRNNPLPGSHEYQEKRQRNNVAVRKCRQKTKEKNKELQNKVGELQGENANLKKRVEMLTKELTVLKSLFTNVHKPAPARLEKVNL